MSQHMRDDLFRQMLGEDVQPLTKGRDKADVEYSPSAPSEAQLARRAQAEADESESNFLSDEFVELVGPADPIEYRRDGIQLGVVERLRHGGYAPEAYLHLQKRPLEVCRRELFRFIRDAREHDLRCVLIVHGRSKEAEGQANIARSYVGKWLAQFDEVQAYVSAHKSHGGLGATYAMLRKSERARARNRERQQKRRG
ncbi:DNA endonuclease SmrA [Chromohalobacter sarecensis]|uniref:DNA endonuclease SmrA n=1 Tax=Chromohalobacter sarecensis TaxID=245294 RepID=A0ABV9CVM9_9GAMM|nr:DNA endonuclease SmrA [Chromohalobacter sarecensis]MCK0715750.1 DNA endonuclease SmrA [Chromohalobacter sarecensis]